MQEFDALKLSYEREKALSHNLQEVVDTYIAQNRQLQEEISDKSKQLEGADQKME